MQYIAKLGKKFRMEVWNTFYSFSWTLAIDHFATFYEKSCAVLNFFLQLNLKYW